MLTKFTYKFFEFFLFFVLPVRFGHMNTEVRQTFEKQKQFSPLAPAAQKRFFFTNIYNSALLAERENSKRKVDVK